VDCIIALRIADVVLMVVLSLAAAFGLVYLAGVRAPGGYAEIIRHGAVVRTLPLSEGGEYRAEYGEFVNVVAVSGGVAVMRGSNCLDGHCLRQPGISFTGQTIVCLPNRLVVQVRAAGYAEYDILLH